MNKPNCIVIGSGMGGLTAAILLARGGYNVTVLEQQHVVGGCLQCFNRAGVSFETGMHFLGSAYPNQSLGRFFPLFGLEELPLSPLNPEAYDIVSLDGQRFEFASGRQNFANRMAAYFPGSEKDIRRYLDAVDQVASASAMAPQIITGAQTGVIPGMDYHTRSINDILDTLTDNQTLKNVLLGTLPLYAGQKDRTSFALHAFLMDFYNRSAYRVPGGSQQIAQMLAKTLETLGGRIATRSKVTKIVCDGQTATGVEINGDLFMAADLIVCTAHPDLFIEMTAHSQMIRPAYRQRLQSLPDTSAPFTVYIKFRPDTVQYMNSNFYAYDNPSPWGCEQYTDRTWPKGYLYMHGCTSPTQKFADTAQIITYMDPADLAPWHNTLTGRRGDEYENFKKQKAQKVIDRVEKDFPGLRNAIDAYWTSTPLTYRDYTGTRNGSMYGILRDITLGAAGRIGNRTRIPNVVLAGQNTNSHGILGVIVGSLVAATEILGRQNMARLLKKYSLLKD